MSESEGSRQAGVEAVVPADPTDTDVIFLHQTIDRATDAKNRGRHPFAATVVSADGTVIASAGNNSMPPEGDPTRHAELECGRGSCTKSFG